MIEVFSKDTYIDVKGMTEEQVELLAEAYGVANDVPVGDIESRPLEGYHYLYVLEEGIDGPVVFVGDCAGIEHLTSLNVEKDNSDEGVDFWLSDSCGDFEDFDRKQGDSWGNLTEQVTEKQEYTVLFDIDVFRNAAQLIFDTNEFVRKHLTLSELEQDLKEKASECVSRMNETLKHNSEYYGQVYVGTYNFRVQLDWIDDNMLELKIPVFPKSGTTVAVPLGELKEALEN